MAVIIEYIEIFVDTWSLHGDFKSLFLQLQTRSCNQNTFDSKYKKFLK